MITGFCRACKWWRSIEDASERPGPDKARGVCRGGPPAILTERGVRWPIVQRDDFCGSYENYMT